MVREGIKGHTCAYYEGAQVKPNEGCPVCPFWMKDNCTDKGVILHVGTYLENVRGRAAFASLRAAITRLLGNYGVDAFRWASVEAGIIDSGALITVNSQSDEKDRVLTVLGAMIQKRETARKSASVWKRLDMSELRSALEKLSLYEFQGGSDSGGFSQSYCIHCKQYNEKHLNECPVEVIERWLAIEEKKEKKEEVIIEEPKEEDKKDNSLDNFIKE